MPTAVGAARDRGVVGAVGVGLVQLERLCVVRGFYPLSERRSEFGGVITSPAALSGRELGKGNQLLHHEHHELGSVLELPQRVGVHRLPHDVVVVDTLGGYRAAVIGELMTHTALGAGLAGFAADHAYAQAVLSGEVARMESVARRYADLGRHFRSGRTLVEAALLAEPHDRAEAARLATLAEGTLAPFRADGDLAPVRHLLAKRRGRPATGPNLSASERAVVGLVAEGLTNTEIAERLSVSRRTVESHVSSAYRKLEVSNRVELARAATAQT